MEQSKLEMRLKGDEGNRDEYSTRQQPAQPSLHDRYGFDERDGLQEEEHGPTDDPDERLHFS